MPLYVTEELAESWFNTLVPLELLWAIYKHDYVNWLCQSYLINDFRKCFQLEDRTQLDEMVYNIGAVSAELYVWVFYLKFLIRF